MKKYATLAALMCAAMILIESYFFLFNKTVASVETEEKNFNDPDINIFQATVNKIMFANDVIKNKINTMKEIKERYDQQQQWQEPKRPYIEGIPLDNDLLDYIWKRSLEEDLAYTFILAIIGVESNYGRYTYNVNKNGTVDSGIAQINSSNVQWLSKLAGIDDVDVHNDFHNIDMMIELLKYERDYFRSLGLSEEDVFYLTCLAYNRGRSGAINHVKKYGFDSSSYVEKVLKEKEVLESKIY